MERLSKDRICDIYASVLKLGRKIKVVNNRIVLYFYTDSFYYEYNIINNRWKLTQSSSFPVYKFEANR